MSAPLRLVLFDCDGTLVDSQHAIIGAMTVAWRAAGYDDPDPEAVRRVVGLSLVQAIAVLRPDAGPDRHEWLAERYKEAFGAERRRGVLQEPLFPGILGALDALDAAGVLLGIVTGKSRRGLVAALESHGLLGRFVTLQTADVGPGKPHPAMVHRALAEVGAEAADTVVVGDTTFDIQMACNAQVASVGVAWGYHEVAELVAAGAGRIVRDGADVPAVVLALLTGRNSGQRQ